MRVIVLGSAAGGGFPQWNSNAAGCQRARSGDPLARRRTQTSIAISADERRWVILNAAPDLKHQIDATPSLWPNTGLRSTPIAMVILTGGDLDAIAGLLNLRERERLVVAAPRQVLDVLARNTIFDALSPEFVERRELPIGRATALADAHSSPLGLVIDAFEVPGKVPLYLEDAEFEARFERGEPIYLERGSGTIGVHVRSSDSNESLYFIPGCAAMTPALARRLDGASVVLFDGTLWCDDEMPRAGIGSKTGRRMGHMSIDGDGGTIAAFRELHVARKVFIHINNSNPILLEDSAEHAAARAAGWEVAFDGMEIRL